MEALTPTPLKSPLKTTNNDAAMLRQLADELNSSVKLTPEQVKENERILAAEFNKASAAEGISAEAQLEVARSSKKEVLASQVAQVQTPLPASPPAKLFITGHLGAGILELLLPGLPETAALVSLNTMANETLRATALLRGNPPLAVLTEFRKFGDGQYLPTLSNILFLGLIRKTWEDFGTSGFWAKQAIVTAAHRVRSQQIIVGVRTSEEFKLLQAQGFSHYHAMCSPGDALKRLPTNTGLTDSQLAQALDSDVQKKISVQRTGPRLNVVWTDTTTAAPADRFYSVADFRKAVLGLETVTKVENDLQANVI